MAEPTDNGSLHIGKEADNRPSLETFFVAHRIPGIHYDEDTEKRGRPLPETQVSIEGCLPTVVFVKRLLQSIK